MSNRNELVRGLLSVITMSELQNLVNTGEEARPIPAPRRKGQNHALFGGARSGAVVRALASHQCGPGSNPGVDSICGLSLLLVLSFAPRGFSPGTPVFPSPQKPTFPNSNSTRNKVDEEPLCGSATSKSLFTYLFIPAPRRRTPIPTPRRNFRQLIQYFEDNPIPPYRPIAAPRIKEKTTSTSL